MEDWKGLNYVNPYSHEVWEYVVQVAEDAARHGFPRDPVRLRPFPQ